MRRRRDRWAGQRVHHHQRDVDLQLGRRGVQGTRIAGVLLAALGAWQMFLAFGGLVFGRVLIRDSAPGAIAGFFATAILLSLTGQSLTIGVTAWVVVGVVVLGRLIGYRKVRADEDVGLFRLLARRFLLDRDEP